MPFTMWTKKITTLKRIIVVHWSASRSSKAWAAVCVSVALLATHLQHFRMVAVQQSVLHLLLIRPDLLWGEGEALQDFHTRRWSTNGQSKCVGEKVKALIGTVMPITYPGWGSEKGNIRRWSAPAEMEEALNVFQNMPEFKLHLYTSRTVRRRWPASATARRQHRPSPMMAIDRR